MYPSEIVFQPALGRARGFSALVITADRLFGTRLTSNLVHSGADRVDVVRTVSEIRPAAGLEERDLIVADLDLPDEAAHLLLDDVQRLQGHYLVAVLAPQSAHLAEMTFWHGAWSLLFKLAATGSAVAATRPFAGALTPVEHGVLNLVAEGAADAEIAQRTGETAERVRAVVTKLKVKFAARNRAHLVGEALRTGVLD